ncbi:MAG: hypothetical protein LBG48_02325 [Rickettsiales bacterium]|nr:hypothetical protein [Rickettsiales bacterium]
MLLTFLSWLCGILWPAVGYVSVGIVLIYFLFCLVVVIKAKSHDTISVSKKRGKKTTITSTPKWFNCPVCGYLIINPSLPCPSCGNSNSVSASTIPSQAQDDNIVDELPIPTIWEKISKRKLVLFFGMLLILFLLISFPFIIKFLMYFLMLSSPILIILLINHLYHRWVNESIRSKLAVFAAPIGALLVIVTFVAIGAKYRDNKEREERVRLEARASRQSTTYTPSRQFIKGNYLIAMTAELLEEAERYEALGDRVALNKLINLGLVIRSPGEIEVDVQMHSFGTGIRKIRPKGEIGWYYISWKGIERR